MCQIPWTIVPAIRASVVLISFADLVKMKGRKKRKGNDKTKEEVMAISGGGKETWIRHQTLAFIILIVAIQDVASTFLGRLSPCIQCICTHVYSHVHTHTHTCAHTHTHTHTHSTTVSAPQARLALSHPQIFKAAVPSSWSPLSTTFSPGKLSVTLPVLV